MILGVSAVKKQIAPSSNQFAQQPKRTNMEEIMRLLAIDGNSIMNRAFYGIRLLSNHKGIYTNAIFGFMNIYLKHVTALQPDAIAVAFDVHTPTFRHQKVSSYKANRKGMPEELAMQMP